MNDHTTTVSTKPVNLSSEEVASELNNLLQIISGTSDVIENIWEGKPGAAKYFEMLRESVARAAEVTTDLVERSGRKCSKIVLHPHFVSLKEPPATSAVSTPIPTPPQKASRPKQRILVVDDEKMLLILTAEILREEGYEVVTAQSGFECLDLFRANGRRFDLVLLDLNMPLMDGEETFHRLRALDPKLRVMLCTGFVQKERLDRMMSEGLSGFVQKPLGPQQYLSSIRAVLAKAAAAHCVLA